ncbi:MAG: redoxin domain-containing protein [Anaerolineae bacterium]|nr:redoxin domain-containing protein [Anaerolineae bacterium]
MSEMTTPELPVTNSPPSRRLPFWVIALSFVLLAGFLALIAWGLRNAQAGPVTVGEPAPDFEFVTFDGQALTHADMQGKVIVVNFWASWCQPCEQEAAELEEAWQQYQPSNQVLFLGIDYVDTEDEARLYLQKFDITYPNGPDLRSNTSKVFRIRGVPETYFIDRTGRLAYIQVGPFTSTSEITRIIDTILAQ